MRNLLGLALLMSAGCYQESAYAQGAPTVGTQPSWQGPPGGDMDPQYGAQPYQVPQQPVDPNAEQGYAEDPNAAQQQPAEDPNYGTQTIDDGQIDATLDAYGTWQEDEDYGRIWVPNATEVGVDFTPYETGGSWVYSDSGYMFDCDAYSWGWLPFHYGRWGWFDGYWGWVPGYNWGPAWVDWRYGGGYVGWRPIAPEWRNGEHWNVRDHRHQAQVMDSHWRFANEGEMTKGPIRGHLFKNPAEGLRATQPMRPPAPAGIAPVHSASIMRARMPASVAHPAHSAMNGPRGPFNAQHPSGAQPQYRQPAYQQPYRAPQAYRQPYQPTYRAPQAYRQPAYQQPYRQPAYQQPYRQPAYQQPYRAPQSYYRPPQQTYRPPAPQYHPAPANRPSYSAPSRSYSAPTYSAPSHSYSAPSHSYSAPSHSYSAPSHSSGGGGGGHSSGGGHHR